MLNLITNIKMSKDIILKVENISKQYRLGVVGTGTISHDLNRWWHKVRGKDNPYLKIGEVNDRSTKAESDYVWALQDINFEVERGEVLGIIGKNGAGKSTLLKILSRVTSPTTGSIKTRGRIASLLEVGTGFHGEMTGRENIFLNGSILGMTKKEIISKIDEIIDFSGCKRYIDTPVKRYSSGMTVRLAFAVAAFLEPEILVVDEVLAVGDAEFQKKAIGKMQDMSRGGGRTVLFVSHNLAAVKSLCTRGILMEHGKITKIDSIANIINLYSNRASTKSVFEYPKIVGKTQILKIELHNENNLSTNIFHYDNDIYCNIFVEKNIAQPKLAINFKDSDFNLIFVDELDISSSGMYQFFIKKNFFLKGSYILDVHLYSPNIEFYDSKIDQVHLEIADLPEKFAMYENANCGLINSPLVWTRNR